MKTYTSTVDSITIRLEVSLCKEHLDSVTALRYASWKNRLEDPADLDDGHDAHALHWLVFAGATLSAAARMCIHDDLRSVPDPHLYKHLAPDHFPLRIACINRLVVDKNIRGRGVAYELDRLRREEASKRGCRSMIVGWNSASGPRRQLAIQAQGFQCLSNDGPIPDGKYGASLAYGKLL